MKEQLHTSQFPVLDIHRRPVFLVTSDKVPYRREQRNAAKHGTVPIHRRRVDQPGRGKETEDEEGGEKGQRNAIDGQTPAAERKSRRRKRLAADSFEKHTTDGQYVGAEQ